MLSRDTTPSYQQCYYPVQNPLIVGYEPTSLVTPLFLLALGYCSSRFSFPEDLLKIIWGYLNDHDELELIQMRRTKRSEYFPKLKYHFGTDLTPISYSERAHEICCHPFNWKWTPFCNPCERMICIAEGICSEKTWPDGEPYHEDDDPTGWMILCCGWTIPAIGVLGLACTPVGLCMDACTHLGRSSMKAYRFFQEFKKENEILRPFVENEREITQSTDLLSEVKSRPGL